MRISIDKSSMEGNIQSTKKYELINSYEFKLAFKELRHNSPTISLWYSRSDNKLTYQKLSNQSESIKKRKLAIKKQANKTKKQNCSKTAKVIHMYRDIQQQPVWHWPPTITPLTQFTNSSVGNGLRLMSINKHTEFQS